MSDPVGIVNNRAKSLATATSLLTRSGRLIGEASIKSIPIRPFDPTHRVMAKRTAVSTLASPYPVTEDLATSPNRTIRQPSGSAVSSCLRVVLIGRHPRIADCPTSPGCGGRR